jgi:lysophospholipase L1-like esterase
VSMISVNGVAALAAIALAAWPAQCETLRFSFGGTPQAGYTQVTPADTYTAARGYGLEPGFTGADGKPYFFSVTLPEGNYRVTVKLGDANAPSDTTVYAELRRLMLEQVRTRAGEFTTRSFLVNVRRTKIASGGEVRITDREKTMEAWAWDDRLTLEVNGARPAAATLAIEPSSAPTLFLIGDSTVCDQPREPFNSWGQMITRFLKPEIVVSNQAESGESVAGALAKGRFDKIWDVMKRGDWLLVQFGHNDMKSTAPDALHTFTADLRRVVDETTKRGGHAVLFTPVSRRSFDETGKIANSFRGYPDAVKQVAREKGVPLIDLQSMAAAFYEALGPEGSHAAFANASENTHHNDYGSYQIAQCVLQRMRDLELPLAALIVPDFSGFDPSHPLRPADFHIPPSPLVTNVTPLGR